MRISVIIPTYNRRDLLSRTLPTVLDQDFPVDGFEVIVVVDGSTDGSVELLRGFKPSCALRIIEQANQGQAGARNTGIQAARGELILFLDDDNVCVPSILAKHFDAHSTADNIVVFGPVLVHPASSPNVGTDSLRAWTEDYLQCLAREGGPRFPDQLWIFSNCSILRKTLHECGGFDESMRTSHEDADLAIRLWKMGSRFRYHPGAATYQIYVKTPQALAGTEADWYGREELVLCRKHPEYRPFSCFARIGEGSWSKRFLREIAARLPCSPEPILRAPFWLADSLRWIPPLHQVAMRLFQLRRRIGIFRGAIRKAGSWRSLRSEFGMRLPVLLYPHVGPPRTDSSSVATISPARFARQVRWLARRGYIGIRPSDWLRWLSEGKGLPEKPVLLTFDGAFADLADHAFPLLQDHGFGAGVFVVTGQVGGADAGMEGQRVETHRLMTAEQIRYWASRGIEFGAHGRTHADLTALAGDALAGEIAGSRDDLSEILGTPVVSFAYPCPSYHWLVRDCVQGAFAMAFTTDEGVNTLRTDPHLLRRTRVASGDSIADIRYRLHWGGNPLQRLRPRVSLRTGK